MPRIQGSAALAACAVLLTLAPLGSVRAQSNAELMAIIREQQRQIDELSRKVEALQRQATEASEKADVAAATARQVEEAQDFEFDWGPSPTIRSKDGNFEAHLRGRLLVDGGILDDQDGFYSGDNATELRAARLGIEGTAWRDLGYKLEVDFADNEVDLADAFIEYAGELIDPAFVRVGQFKTPNSLEEQTSNRFLTFMERAAITDAFELERQIGLAGGVTGASWGISAGLFGQNAGDVEANEGFALAGRGHYALLNRLGPRSVVHLGSSVRFRDLDNDVDGNSVRYRQRPFFHFATTRSVDTGDIADADNDVWLGGEAALVAGPFSLQAEAANTWLQRGGAPNATGLWGGYLGASYFLTGETRNYDAAEGVFERVDGARPVLEGGPGAWQIGARLDYLDLNDGGAGIPGGAQYSAIAGINWYFNDYVRFLLNYAMTRVLNARNTPAAVDGSSNVIHGVGTRAQVDF